MRADSDPASPSDALAGLVDQRLVRQLAEAAAAQVASGAVRLLGEGGLLQAFAKQLIEGALELELQEHLRNSALPRGSHTETETGTETETETGRGTGTGTGTGTGVGAGAATGANGRNGARTRRLLTEVGPVEVRVPRDREGSFSPRAVPPRARRLPGLDRLVISLTARGLSSGELVAHLAEVYGVELSRETVSAITDQVLDELAERRRRRLDPVYPVVFVDSVRSGRPGGPLVHLALGVSVEGRREVLGLWPAAGGEQWPRVLAGLAERGVREVWVLVGGTGAVLAEAAAGQWPGAVVHGSVAQLLHTALRHAPGEDWGALSRALRETCTAPTEEAALERLSRAEREWGPGHREVFRVWRSAWPLLAPGFRFGPEARRLLTGGGALERLHARLRRIEQSAGRVRDERAALKRAYLATLALESPAGAGQPGFADWPAVREELRRGSPAATAEPGSHH
ncbi:transposase [Kitasatospora sp. NPDC056651]|uniref:IS256 family transposase n=1 Tax=Kitasatospora sp. NPDC056651 TaxID=3345892 RepID=UPI0036898A61